MSESIKTSYLLDFLIFKLVQNWFRTGSNQNSELVVQNPWFKTLPYRGGGFFEPQGILTTHRFSVLNC